jgi:hypothetical protein
VTLADELAVKLVSPAYLHVTVLVPLVLKVKAQFPAPAMSVPVQCSPLLAEAVTDPVGTPFPVTLKVTVTIWPTSDGLGVIKVIVVELPAFVTLSFTLAAADV